MEANTEYSGESSIIDAFNNDSAIVLLFGTFAAIGYLYLMIRFGILSSFFQALGRRFSFLRYDPGTNEIQNADVRRIHSDECSICFGNIQFEVGAACGHIFCGKCITNYWLTRQHRKLDCPLCRREINMLIRHFDLNHLQTNQELQVILNDIKYYNACFAPQRRTLYEIINDAPYYLRRFTSFVTTWEGFVFLLKKILTSLYILALLAYIISPFDLIPDFIFVIGWIDDLIALVFILLYITVLYYNFLRNRQ